jgi:hypothetical protein
MSVWTDALLEEEDVRREVSFVVRWRGSCPLLCAERMIASLLRVFGLRFAVFFFGMGGGGGKGELTTGRPLKTFVSHCILLFYVSVGSSDCF